MSLHLRTNESTGLLDRFEIARDLALYRLCKRLTRGRHRWKPYPVAFGGMTGRECRLCRIWETYPEAITTANSNATSFTMYWNVP